MAGPEPGHLLPKLAALAHAQPALNVAALSVGFGKEKEMAYRPVTQLSSGPLRTGNPQWIFAATQVPV